MQENHIPERRRAPRVHVDFPLEFVHPFPREVIRVKNISTSGICCLSAFPLTEMTRVGIILKLPDAGAQGAAAENIKCEGAVVRCVPASPPGEAETYELAIFLTDIPPESQAALKRFIDSRLVRG